MVYPTKTPIMEKNPTKEEIEFERIKYGICEQITEDAIKHGSDEYSRCFLAAQEMFSLLWPLVGKSFDAGEDSRFELEESTFEPKEQFLTNTLNKLTNGK